MKNVIKLLLLSLILMSTKCEDKESENCHTSIRFSNNSEKDLYVRLYDLVHRPPGVSEIEHISSTVQQRYKVYTGEQDNREATHQISCIESFFRGQDTKTLYVFDAAVVENTSWGVVARDSLVLKRYDLTLEDLQRLNWFITYPPTEAMKDIKMYPPYGQ